MLGALPCFGGLCEHAFLVDYTWLIGQFGSPFSVTCVNFFCLHNPEAAVFLRLLSSNSFLVKVLVLYHTLLFMC